LSVHSADKISPELTRLFKDKAKVHCESGDYLFVMNADQRLEFRAKVAEKAVGAAWEPQSENLPFDHHMLFEVNNEEANNLPPIKDDSDSSFEL